MRDVDFITEGIIGDAIAVHRELGPGLLESTYEECGYRLDLVVEGRVVVELKSIAKLEPVHFAQMMTYLRLSGCEVGLLINFNVTRLTDGLRRVVRSYRPPNPASLRPSA